MSLGEEDDVDDERMMHVLRNGVDEVERTMPRRRGGGGGGGRIILLALQVVVVVVVYPPLAPPKVELMNEWQ